MGFDRAPCRAGLLVISAVIMIPFLITYLIHIVSFSCHTGGTLVPTSAMAPQIQLVQRLPFPHVLFFHLFFIPWILSHALLEKWIITF